MPKEPTVVKSAKIGARAATITAVIAVCGTIAVALINRACTKQPSPGTNQSVSGARNVVAQGQQITVNVSGDMVANTTNLPLTSTWFAEMRYLSPLGIDFRAGIGSAMPNGIFELTKLIYQERHTNSYGVLRQYRDRILKVNPQFGYVNWLWGCILKRRFHQEDEAQQAFLESIQQLKEAANASPENPYPPFYLFLLYTELGNDDMADWYFQDAIGKPVHLQSQWMLPIEFDAKQLRRKETYERCMTFWAIWQDHAMDGGKMNICDVTSAWQDNHESESKKWIYEYDNGEWVHHITMTIEMPDYPPDEEQRHYIDISLGNQGRVYLFDTVSELLSNYNARMITTNEEHTRLSELPDGVMGYGDPGTFAFPFINSLTNGLMSQKIFPNDLGILKVQITNEYFVGFCSTNDFSDGVIRLYLDGSVDNDTKILALPATWLGKMQYKKPDR